MTTSASSATYAPSIWEKNIPADPQTFPEELQSVEELLDVETVNGSKRSIVYAEQTVEKIVQYTRGLFDWLQTLPRDRNDLSISFFESMQLVFAHGDEMAILQTSRSPSKCSATIQKIIRLSASIKECIATINKCVTMKMPWFHRIQMAAILTREEINPSTFYSSTDFGLPATIIKYQGKPSIVLLGRNKKVAGGAYKDYFFGMAHTLRSKLIPILQAVPCGGDKKFDVSVLDNLQKLSSYGSPCLKCRAIFKNLQAQGEPIDELVIMDYCPGGSLDGRTYLKRGAERNLLTSVEQRLVFMQIAIGLSLIHNDDCVHGDIKSANALLSGQGTNIRGILCDPDLLRKCDAKVKLIHQILYGGSLPYAPPEMLKECCDFSGGGKKADVYALGCIAYEMAIGLPSWYFPLIDHAQRCKNGVDAQKRELDKQLRMDPSNKVQILADYTKELTRFLRSDPLRNQVINEQNLIVEKRKDLETLSKRTLEQEFHLITYKVMEPDPKKRLTINQLLDELALKFPEEWLIAQHLLNKLPAKPSLKRSDSSSGINKLMTAPTHKRRGSF